MGRVKKRKPRTDMGGRREPAENLSTAKTGDLYNTWYELAAHVDFDSHGDEDHAAFPLLLELYQRKIPEAAFVLDSHIKCGNMPMRSESTPFEIKWISCTDLPGVVAGEERRALHELHIRGFLLINDDGSVSRSGSRPIPEGS
ncbi:hypothetical protein STHAL_03845 [Streptomyces halstedii]|uniref:Uncharacterized protein n=1 Tax=Streptomyces halstedii TaxID=1944 RepID=A0ABS6TK91_STRHA|nr:hypothetical protein [Streptomyces halstedii]MBV7668635.1 hypothetical protein [Streptomyces halstedii]